jgi:hypothetical protein
MHRVVGGGSNRRDGWPTTGLKPVARREKWLVSISGDEPVKRPIYEHQTRMLALKMLLAGLFCFRLMSIQTCFAQDSLFCAAQNKLSANFKVMTLNNVLGYL